MTNRFTQYSGALLAMICTPDHAWAQDVIDENSISEPSILQEFAIDRSDRMTVQVQVNGSAAVPFIVDTGSERTVIANDLAKRLLLEAGPQLTLATISGRTVVNSFFIDTLTTSSVKLEGFEAPGLDRSNLGAYGLLGIDSLEDNRVLLDFPGRRWMCCHRQKVAAKASWNAV